MPYLHANRRDRTRADLIAVLVFLACGGLIAALSPGQQAGLASIVRRSALYPFLELHRASSERAGLQRRAAALRTERDSLVSELAEYRRVAEQATQLRSGVGLAGPAVGSFAPAEVYPGRPRIGDSNEFVLRGRQLASVTLPAGVFTGRGLVGVARARHVAGVRGEFWSHPDFRISVQTEDGAITGIVRPYRRDGGQPIMLLEGAPFQSEIVPGVHLFTTGVAGIYPPGLRVGTIRERGEEESGWMKRYYVEPAVRPEDADVVLVWRRPELGL
jgi:cell shape-determining protein MreC